MKGIAEFIVAFQQSFTVEPHCEIVTIGECNWTSKRGGCILGEVLLLERERGPLSEVTTEFG